MQIIHTKESGKFNGIVDGLESSLHYSRSGSNNSILDIYRTFVPEELRGRKIAEQLVAAAIEFARSEGCLIHPTCSYVVHYFKCHPEFAPLLDPTTDHDNGGSCRVR